MLAYLRRFYLRFSAMNNAIAFVGLRLRCEPKFTTSPKSGTGAGLSLAMIDAKEFEPSADVAVRLNELRS